MVEIQGRLVSTEILENSFLCRLEACKGACCIEGDEGAPVTAEEILAIEQNLLSILPYLDPESQEKVKIGLTTSHENGSHSTPLKKNKACVYSVYDEAGILRCAIEQAFLDGKSSFQKPISCHLYPIRVSQLGDEKIEVLNYHHWDICHAACLNGAAHKMPVYRFLQSAIIRRYGLEFYAELEQVAQSWAEQKNKSI
jgi:hypothetical protein